MNLTYTINGLDNLQAYVEDLPVKQKRAAVQAINKTADRARASAARHIRDQVNFPGGYLNPGQNRLVVDRKASGTNLEAAVAGRARATSLARFVIGNPQPRSGDSITVAIQRGEPSVELKRAFMVRLRSGKSDSKHNLGIAIRTGNRQKPNNAYKPTSLGNGVYLLYGPSVSQVFKSVRYDIEPDTLKYLGDEYERLLKVNL
jgi:hypothetical protein